MIDKEERMFYFAGVCITVTVLGIVVSTVIYNFREQDARRHAEESRPLKAWETERSK